VGRTYAVAVSDGGKALHVGAQEPDEHLRLRFAQLREVCGYVRDWAVVLTDLDPGARELCGRGIAVGRERRSQNGWTPISGHLIQCG
jgi:hypothetical protein